MPASRMTFTPVVVFRASTKLVIPCSLICVLVITLTDCGVSFGASKAGGGAHGRGGVRVAVFGAGGTVFAGYVDSLQLGSLFGPGCCRVFLLRLHRAEWQ